jgi:2'-5' RNA ligase
MASPYLIEVRTSGDEKDRLREIIYDVSDRFDVHTIAEPRAVPHITLFGPYNTDRGHEVRNHATDVFRQFDVVPYRISGFDHFRDDVIYANVVPSPELRRLRQRLSEELRPITYNYQPHDSDRYYDFHITIARGDLDGQFDAIWNYVREAYDPQFDEYATRVTNLRQSDMLWEYDLLQDRRLSPEEATSAQSWKKTMGLLEEEKSEDDHTDLAPKNGLVSRISQLIR